MKLRQPDIISIYAEGHERVDSARLEDVQVGTEAKNGELAVYVTADATPVRYVRLRWNFRADEVRREHVRVLGDHWERGYGDMEWRGIVPQRCMPWDFAVSNGSDADADVSQRITECFGVRVRPGALCFWQYDECGVTLWLDVRNGGSGVILGRRRLLAARVLFAEYAHMTAFHALRQFFAIMCRDALLPEKPVYGFNNWYYAYGKSSHGDILRDTRWLAGLCGGLKNRPFMVIDDGWQPYPTDYPWDRGNERFPDMAQLAEDIKAMDVRPGIWVRYLIDGHHEMTGLPEGARLMRDEKYLDPSHPSVKAAVAENTRRLVKWGYQLIKHDFSTFDIFGRWGFQCPDNLTVDGWHFYDRTRTSAEIVIDFYRTIREAAGPDTLILGCNVIGHLAAGLVHLNRTGDDTSGRRWDVTRKMGINTLAFRMLQDKTFYGADADCAAFTARIDQKMGLKWLDILSKSGTSLFVSPEPGALDAEGVAQLKAALRRNSVQSDVLEPVDWMETVSPREYILNGKAVNYNWYPEIGTDSFNP